MSLVPSDLTLKADGLTAQDLKHVMPKNCEVKNDHLYLAGVDLVSLARENQTALFVYDEEMIESKLLEYKESLAERLPKSHVAYASKAFICKTMVKIVDRLGLWLDVSSGGELYLANAAGFPMEHCLFHGNNKTPQEIREAIKLGVGRFVVDTTEELERISETAVDLGVNQPVILRITPGVVADTHRYIQTGAEDSKFGFTIQDDVARDALFLALSLPHVELMGLHFHIGSQIFNLESYEEAVSITAQFCSQMADEMDFHIQELIVGGGLGINYTVHDEAPSIRELSKVLSQCIIEKFKEIDQDIPTIFVEPGRSVVGSAGLTLYTVGSVKEIEGVRTYVNVDGGMSDNIRTALYDAQYESLIVNKAEQARNKIVTIAGKHCESGDVVNIDCSLQSAEPGDVLAVFSTGAYCDSMASNYNLQVRPGVVFVRDGSYRYVKRRETYDDLLLREI